MVSGRNEQKTREHQDSIRCIRKQGLKSTVGQTEGKAENSNESQAVASSRKAYPSTWQTTDATLPRLFIRMVLNRLGGARWLHVVRRPTVYHARPRLAGWKRRGTEM